MTTGKTPDEARAIVQRVLRGYLVAGASYPAPLPAELALWYCYTRDGGHSIVVVLTSQVQPGEDVEGSLVPAPVKAVLRVGYEARSDGYVWCDLPYDPDLGLVTDPGDDEY